MAIDVYKKYGLVNGPFGFQYKMQRNINIYR